LSRSSSKLAQLFNEAGLPRRVDLHPSATTPAATFEAAAATARSVAAGCLPLGLGLVMHLYPLCALRSVPLTWWSPAAIRRAWLLRTIDRHGLILANAGSERVLGTHSPVTVTRRNGGMLVNGTFDYVSLANAADMVLFNAPLNDGDANIFCMADLRADTAVIGTSRFNGNMRLSDTCPVTFHDQYLPPGRFVVVPGESALDCMTLYQRSWFHLLLGESYLARINELQRRWELPHSTAELADRNELALLRDYALRLLDEARPGQFEALSRTTTTMKLRISWLAQATAAALQGIDDSAAGELQFLKRQPTSDDRIVRRLATDWASLTPTPA
jgi:hypothetical protein